MILHCKANAHTRNVHRPVQNDGRSSGSSESIPVSRRRSQNLGFEGCKTQALGFGGLGFRVLAGGVYDFGFEI